MSVKVFQLKSTSGELLTVRSDQITGVCSTFDGAVESGFITLRADSGMKSPFEVDAPYHDVVDMIYGSEDFKVMESVSHPSADDLASSLVSDLDLPEVLSVLGTDAFVTEHLGKPCDPKYITQDLLELDLEVSRIEMVEIYYGTPVSGTSDEDYLYNAIVTTTDETHQYDA